MTAAIIEDAPIQEDDTAALEHQVQCPVCSLNYPPTGAYRPHTLNPACWCASPTRYGGKCAMTAMFGVTAESE